MARAASTYRANGREPTRPRSTSAMGFLEHERALRGVSRALIAGGIKLEHLTGHAASYFMRRRQDAIAIARATLLAKGAPGFKHHRRIFGEEMRRRWRATT